MFSFRRETGSVGPLPLLQLPHFLWIAIAAMLRLARMDLVSAVSMAGLHREPCLCRVPRLPTGQVKQLATSATLGLAGACRGPLAFRVAGARSSLEMSSESSESWADASAAAALPAPDTIELRRMHQFGTVYQNVPGGARMRNASPPGRACPRPHARRLSSGAPPPPAPHRLGEGI